MTAPRQFPFGGIPVYNPQALSKREALAQFHARQEAYQRLLALLREERPSHVLIIGMRGMGKTTLLQRVRYGVEDDSALNDRYLVLAFPEEQYNLNRLHHFLLNTVDALADTLERLGNQKMLARVEAYAEKMGKLRPDQIEEEVPKFLAEIGREMQRSLLLLVDNADRLFETIEEREQWKLRELLSTRPDLTLFGATTQASDGIYGPERAFFEFFQIHRLTPLTFAEVKDLLLRLSESVDEKEGEEGEAKRRVEEWLAADPGRLRTLVQLIGGNPRTTVLLFHLVLDGLAGGAREYLEQLLDQCTPNYKGRVDDLPAQSQQVLDAVALRWDPATAMEVAEDTGLETTTVSTQLTRLVRQGLVEKVDPGDSKKALYQVAERFFNIWYLMRASRRVRAKLRWFVEFLRVFFDFAKPQQQLTNTTKHCLRTLLTTSRPTTDEVDTTKPDDQTIDSICADTLAASFPIFIEASHSAGFWNELLKLTENRPPFARILLGICGLILERDSSNDRARLCRAVALAQLGDFPRASVALDDALAGDPIALLASGKRDLELFLAAAVRSARVRDCLELLDKKDWKDAWRPIYEALKAVESGSADYLKRVAVEIRDPALLILRRIAPSIPGLPAHAA